MKIYAERMVSRRVPVKTTCDLCEKEIGTVIEIGWRVQGVELSKNDCREICWYCWEEKVSGLFDKDHWIKTMNAQIEYNKSQSADNQPYANGEKK